MEKTKPARLTAIDKNITFLLPLVLMALDYVAVILAEELALFSRFHSLWDVNSMQIGQLNYWLTVPIVFILFLHVQKLYKIRSQFWQIIPRIFYGCNYAMVAVIVLMYIAKVSSQSSRLFIGFLWVYSFVFVTLFRYAAKKVMERAEILQLPVIIAGGGPVADALAKGIRNEVGMGYRVLGLVTDMKPEGEHLKDLPILGGLEDIDDIIAATGVKTIMVAINQKPQGWVNNYIRRIQLLVKDVIFVPNLVEMPMGNIEAETLFDEKIILLGVKNNLARPWNILIKTVFDYVLTIVGGILISPILAYVAWKIKSDSPGPVIYDGERIGKNGKLFKCYKFRSMYTNGDEILEKYLAENPEKRVEWETYHKLDDDPRVTPIGKFIRKTSIDELPQLLNVLLGDMSLVGARPYLPREKEEMGLAYDTIILAKPGITGYWQVNGRSDVDFNSRLKMDCWYISNWQVWMDIALLWKTVWVVLRRDGAK